MADGTIIFDTKMDLSGLSDGFKDAEKDSSKSSKKITDNLDDIGDKSESTGKSIAKELAGGFAKVAAAVSLKEIGEEVIDFGKECIDLGSDLEEVQNVVDVTFETMSDRVNDFARDAQKSAGLSEKMAKQYTGTFGAMADSFGFTEQEAYDMSTALTQLTGDVASFYNLSQDEAMNKLKGVFTGETEALKELGVVMTQTALDSYALANGFEKTTAQMSEQEKVALRYQFVMDQLAAASGDFVRTQDSWANQCKVLSLQFESLMATLGSGLIDGLSPGIEFLNDTVLPALQNFADEFAEAMEPKPSKKLSDSLEDLTDTMKDAEKQFGDTSAEIEFSAALAKNYVERLDELEAAGLNNADAQQEYANVVAQLNSVIPELNLTINESTGLVNMNRDAIYGEIEAMKQKALYIAMQDRYNAALNAQVEAAGAIVDAEMALTGIEAERETIMESLTAATGMQRDELVSLYNGQLQYNAALQAGGDWGAVNAGIVQLMTGAYGQLTEAQMQQISQMLALETEEAKLNTTIAEGNAAIADQEVQLKKWNDAMNGAVVAASGATEGQRDVAAATQETTAAVDTLIEEYNAAQATARQSIDSQIGYFDELTIKSSSSAEEIIGNWASQKEAFDNYSANLQKAVDMGLDQTLVDQLSDGSTESMAILNEFVNDTDLSVDDINSAFQKVEQSRETVSGVMADIQTQTSQKLDAIASDMEREWGDMADTVGEAIDDAQAYINSLTGRTVYNNVITRYSSTGTKPSGIGSGYSSAAPSAASAVSIPMLAKGAVIPPNAPFLAVLGDQRRGTNVEAPLSTIQEAVAAVMEDNTQGMMRGFEALLEENRMLRDAVENIRIGDDMLGRAVDRYRRRMAVINGGYL